MSPLRLLLRSLAYHRGTGIAVALGLATATAVVTGALVTGDSMRGSLRDTGLARLGRISHALVAPRYFREALAADLTAQANVASSVERIEPVLLSRGAARNPDTAAATPGVTVFGVDAGFWQVAPVPQPPDLQGRQCALNQALAQDLGVKAGDPLLVTVYRPGDVALDSLLARRQSQDVAPSVRLQVAAVLPAGGPGDFRLDTQSTTPRNVFVSRAWLAERLDLAGRANVLVAAGAPGAEGALARGLAAACRLGDHGLKVAPVPGQGYLSVTSYAMLLTEAQAEAARAAADECGARSALASVYLATRVARAHSADRRELAYAVIAGVEPLAPWPGGLDRRAPGDRGIWLNAWAAQDLGCHVGEALEVSYLVPTREGAFPEARTTLTLEAVVPMAGPAADPSLVPSFDGITDAQTMQDWSPPFPVDLHRVTQRDEQYWDRYRAAPKAFASLATVRAMWRSGLEGEDANWITSVRVAPGPGADLAALQARFSQALLRRLAPSASGLAFRPVRELALQASRGTSDFGQLFLGLSMFLVISALALAAMLLRLSVARRASDVGIMLACGWEEAAATRALLLEGVGLTALGALAGAPLGVLYGWAMIRALGTWWRGAVGSTPSVWLHVTATSLLVGGLCGVVAGLATAGWSVRQLRRRRVLDLLSGWQAMAVAPGAGPAWPAAVVLAAALASAVGLAAGALLTGAVPAPLAFFGIGSALLVSGLALAALVLRRLRMRRGAARSLGRLALRNVGAAGGRSLLTLGLLAGATFIIVGTATNARDLSRLDVTRRESGTGGFGLVAVSDVPLAFDLGTPVGRANLGFTPEDETALRGVEVVSFLASPGEDVSCLNLARPAAPRVLGVPPAMIARGGFSVIHRDPVRGRSAWALLDEGAGDAVPAFGDAASVEWTLHSGLGQTYTIPARRLRFVGLLSGSIFAGELLVSERNFHRLFPAITAPSYFLVATPPGREEAVAQILRHRLGDMGFQVRGTRDVLSGFLRVQNTYLSVFLTLGGLGLLLGTLGLAATLVRNALERRRELALMVAVGHPQAAVARMLLIENVGLLAVGLAWGTLSALVAVAPHLASAEAQVNWGALGGVLAAVLSTGCATCLLAVRAVLQSELVPALRRE